MRPAWRRRLRGGAAWWSLAAVAATAGAVRLAGAERDVAAARAAWGTTVTVAVAAVDLPAGATVGADDVVLEARPAAVVPSGAVASLPVGALVTSPVVAGEVVVEARVGAAGRSPVAARVPLGQRAVAVPTGGGAGAVPDLRPGDLVDVLATFTVGGGEAPPTGVVAAGALVVDVTDTSVTVAVPEADAPRLAFAAATAAVTLALVGA